MKSGGGLVQDVNGLSRASLGQLRGQLDSLGLAAGQLRGRLSQPDVPQSHVIQGLYLPGDRGHILKELKRFLHGHIQHIVDILSLVLHVQGLTVIPFAAADLAGHIYIRQEMHFNLDDAVSAARFAPSALYVEAEPSLAIPLCLGVRGRCEQVPYEVEYACVGSRVGPGSTPDGRLVDVDNLIQLLHALDALVPARYGSGSV